MGEIAAVAATGRWGEVDSAADLALYERLMAEGELRLERS
jgi:hypothetical protein